MQLDSYIRSQQAEATRQALPAILAGTIGISLIAVYVLWPAVNQDYLLLWLIGSVLICVIRWLVARLIRSDEFALAEANRWLRFTVLGSAASGVSWGLIALLFFDANAQVYVLFITCLYAGYTSASMSSNSAYYPAFLAFSAPATVLFASKLLSQDGTIYISIGVVVFFYALMMSYFARRSHRFFETASKSNFENEQLVQEVIRQKETAESAVAAKNKFLASASHDLRQPLHSLGLFVDALDNDAKSSFDKGIIDKIKKSSSALNGLLHSLLDISRLDANIVENRPRDLDLNELVRRVVKEYEVLAQAKNIQVRLTLEDSLVVVSDVVLLERVLRNMIDNAVKFTTAGRVDVTAKAMDGGREVQLRIEDTGIGIPADAMTSIFDEFTQLNNPHRDRQKGLGLGLAIVKRLCSLMDLKLIYTSEEGKGTQVLLSLPRGANPNHTLVANEPNLELQHKVVLVIDDEQDILEGMQTMLDPTEAQTVLALSAIDAIDALHNLDLRPDIIIADFRLAGGDSGVTAVQIIRDEYNAHIPAILVTGDTSPDRLSVAQAADVSVLHKPVAPQELVREMSALMSSAEQL